MIRKLVILPVAAGLLASGCTHNTAVPEGLDLHGKVGITSTGVVCTPRNGQTLLGLADHLAGQKITFSDGKGAVIGLTTTKGPAREAPTGEVDSCAFYVSYSVHLPKTSFYQITYSFAGYGDSSGEQPKSYQEIRAANSTWDVLFDGSP